MTKALIASLKTIAAAPLEAPLSLTGAHYTDPALFAQECATVLRTGWHCLGREDEVPEPGDFFTTRLLNESIIVVRGDDGEIRALANVCRHRGMPLAAGRGSARRFVCRYHACQTQSLFRYFQQCVSNRSTGMDKGDITAALHDIANFKQKFSA